jgi:5-methylcytosine-specific restriction endonuclease McrA
VPEKRCGDCGTPKPTEMFSWKDKAHTQRFPYCRECVAHRAREWRRKNPERASATSRKYYQKNRQRIRAKGNAYERANAEARDARVKKWIANNRERHLMLHRFRQAKRNALKASVGHQATREQIEARLAYYGHSCWMCGEVADSIDHVKPISKGGAHQACNIRPACMGCNARKGDKWPLAQLVSKRTA